MRGFKAFAFAASTSMLLAGALQAQTGTGQVQWMGVNGAHSRYDNVVHSTGDLTSGWDIYRSPYFAQFQINQAPSVYLPPAGTSTFGPTQDIFCTDFQNEANTGTYGAYFTNLGTNGGDVGTYTRSGRTLHQYLEEAWLASQILDPTKTEDQLRAIQGAMWKVISGQPTYMLGSVSGAWSSSGIATWASRADTAAVHVNAYQWVVVTDTSAAGHALGGSQEYLTQVTPEPSTLLLLGTGLLATLLAAGALRRSVG